jgi:hypothetical protein
MKQFSIRDLLFVFVIAALALGWWFDRRPIPPAPARFAITSENNNALVLDTATGEVWSQHFSPNFNGLVRPDIHPPKIPK